MRNFQLFRQLVLWRRVSRAIARTAHSGSRVSPEEQASRAVESNVRWTVHQILDSPEGKARMAEGRTKIVGAVYEIETGRVRFLPPDETR
jgi:carbonic anhydrase